MLGRRVFTISLLIAIVLFTIAAVSIPPPVETENATNIVLVAPVSDRTDIKPQPASGNSYVLPLARPSPAFSRREAIKLIALSGYPTVDAHPT